MLSQEHKEQNFRVYVTIPCLVLFISLMFILLNWSLGDVYSFSYHRDNQKTRDNQDILTLAQLGIIADDISKALGREANISFKDRIEDEDKCLMVNPININFQAYLFISMLYVPTESYHTKRVLKSLFKKPVSIFF